MLLVTDCRYLAVGGELTFQARGNFPDVFAEMAGYIQRYAVQTVVGLVDLVRIGEPALDVGFLPIGQTVGNGVEAVVNRLLVDVEAGLAFFVKEWDDRLVPHRLLHGIGVDDGAELVDGFFVL